MKATHRLIDSVWTVEFYEVSPTEIHIIKFSREDIEGYEKEKTLPQCKIVEDEKRNIVKILVRDNYKSYESVTETDCNRIYNVVNSQYVFSYNGKY